MNDPFLLTQSGKIPFAETVPNGHFYRLFPCFITQGDLQFLQSKHRGSEQQKYPLWDFPTSPYGFFLDLKVQRDFLVPVLRAGSYRHSISRQLLHEEQNSIFWSFACIHCGSLQTPCRI